jgi:hypothetical protein
MHLVKEFPALYQAVQIITSDILNNSLLLPKSELLAAEH